MTNSNKTAPVHTAYSLYILITVQSTHTLLVRKKKNHPTYKSVTIKESGRMYLNAVCYFAEGVLSYSTSNILRLTNYQIFRQLSLAFRLTKLTADTDDSCVLDEWN